MGRRSEDRGDRRRSQQAPRGPPRDRPAPTQDGWNNVPDRPARMSQVKIDLAKMPRRVEAGAITLGPPGGMRPGGGANWGRGSQQGQKKTSVQVTAQIYSSIPSRSIPHSPLHWRIS